MRLGVHLAAVSWIFGASTVATGAMPGVGFLASIAFLGSSFAGPFVGASIAVQTLGPAGLFMVIWLAMAGKRIAGS